MDSCESRLGRCGPALSIKEPALNGILAELVSGAKFDALERQSLRGASEVERIALSQAPAIDVLEALSPGPKVRIIAEVKRASPSKGAMAEIANPAELATVYERSGASAVSVLTESRKFLGSLEDLEQVRKAINLPVLRKDFISLPYQVLEARASGADFILLMASALNQSELVALHDLTTELGMNALVEVHDSEEMKRASDLGARLVGVNARDLDTFELDRTLFERLLDGFPKDAIRVAESAVRSVEDVTNYRKAGADVVLVGEALVTSDPAATLKSFLEAE